MPSNPTSLSAGFMTGSGTAWASAASVSPTAGSLVIAIIGANGNDNVSSVTSGFATGGWTVAATAGAGEYRSAIAWAVASGSPGTGTVSVTFAGTVFAGSISILEVASGFDAVSVVDATAAATFTTANPVSSSFSVTPASDSLLVGACMMRQASGGGDAVVTPESGWTNIGLVESFNDELQPFYAAGSNGASIGATFSGANGTPSGSSLVGIEVLAESAAAATLSSPTSASVTQTGATIGATTDNATGTLYGVVTTSASAPSATQIKAGQDHTGSAAAGSGSNASLTASVNNTIAITGLTAATTYYYYLVQDNGSDSNVVNGTFTTAVAAPTLTSPTAVSIGTTTVTPRVTTDTGNGTCYYVITPQAEGEPSNTQVEAGQNAAGGSPVASGSQVVSASGVITFSEVTGLTAGTAYRISYAHSGTPS